MPQIAQHPFAQQGNCMKALFDMKVGDLTIICAKIIVPKSKFRFLCAKVGHTPLKIL
jgi:hypothetical protein